MKTRVAIASQDGRRINNSCPETTKWWIYDVGEEIQFLGERYVPKDKAITCSSCEDMVLELLSDCKLLFVEHVDVDMENCMLSHGKQMLTASQTVEYILKLVEETQKKQMSLEYFKRVYQLSQIYGSIA